MNSEETRLQILEEIRRDEEKYLSRIQGSLIGGAVGDALGYAVEFNSLESIRRRYGDAGIQAYETDFDSGLAIISDDTQMTLYTANGLLVGFTRLEMRGIMGPPEAYIHTAYLDWYHCQRSAALPEDSRTWLSSLPEMHARRAPGNTCLQALGSGKCGTLEKPINNSKGCGGIMRVAPIALFFKETGSLKNIDLLGAKAAAITHGHPLGYMPAAALVHIVSRAAFGGCPYGNGLYGIVRECIESMQALFEGTPQLDEMLRIMNLAAELSLNDAPDTENIRRLGEGWVAEETLGIALYCCLKYSHDFSKAIIASVNHSGDSDSTGAVAGNILGAWLGMEGIEQKWLNNLELSSVLGEVAKDLCSGCKMSEYDSYDDPVWTRKYIYHLPAFPG